MNTVVQQTSIVTAMMFISYIGWTESTVPTFSQQVNLDPIYEFWDALKTRFDDTKSKCADINGSIGRILMDIDSLNDKYPFNAKAPLLKIQEFESEEEFDVRVRAQQNIDVINYNVILTKRETEKRTLLLEIEKLAQQCVTLTNVMNQVTAEMDDFTNKTWTYTCQMLASDLPYFDRESMSFANIPCPLVSYQNEGHRIRFDVESNNNNISLRFNKLKSAQSFKDGLATGRIKVLLCYEFMSGKPEKFTIRSAWTERKTNSLKAAAAVTIAAIIGGLRRANGVTCNPEELSTSIEYGRENVGALISDEVNHPAIIGRRFPIYIKKCRIKLDGDNVRSLGVELLSPSSNECLGPLVEAENQNCAEVSMRAEQESKQKDAETKMRQTQTGVESQEVETSAPKVKADACHQNANDRRRINEQTETLLAALRVAISEDDLDSSRDIIADLKRRELTSYQKSVVNLCDLICEKLEHAKNGDTESMMWIALQHAEQKTVVKQDRKKAVTWYERAAKKGNPNAMMKLAVWAARGIGGPIDEKRVIYWYNEAAKAKVGDAMYHLGVYYYHGSMGLERSREKAYEMFLGAKANGCTYTAEKTGIDAWLRATKPKGDASTYRSADMQNGDDLDNLLNELSPQK